VFAGTKNWTVRREFAEGGSIPNAERNGRGRALNKGKDQGPSKSLLLLEKTASKNRYEMGKSRGFRRRERGNLHLSPRKI